MLELRVDYNNIDANDDLEVAVKHVHGVEDGDTVIVRDPGDDLIYFAFVRSRNDLTALLDVDWDSAEDAAVMQLVSAFDSNERTMVPGWTKRARNVTTSGPAWSATSVTFGALVKQTLIPVAATFGGVSQTTAAAV